MEITKQSVSLDQDARKIVNKFAKEKGQNFSAALRQIIREWADHNKSEEKIKENNPNG